MRGPCVRDDSCSLDSIQPFRAGWQTAAFVFVIGVHQMHLCRVLLSGLLLFNFLRYTSKSATSECEDQVDGATAFKLEV
jgi:hypothetical protein